MPFWMPILAFVVSGGIHAFGGHKISCRGSSCYVTTNHGSDHIEASGVRQASVGTMYAENDPEQLLYTIVLEHSQGEVVLALPNDNSYWGKQWFVYKVNRNLKKATQSPTDNSFFMEYVNPRFKYFMALSVLVLFLSIIATHAYLKGLTQYTFDKNRGIFVVQQIRGLDIKKGKFPLREIGYIFVGMAIKEGGFPLSEIVSVFTDEKYGRRVLLERQSGKPFPILVQANYNPEELAELIRQFLANPPVENA